MTHQERIHCIEAHHHRLTKCSNMEQREAYIERILMHRLAVLGEVERIEREYLRSMA